MLVSKNKFDLLYNHIIKNKNGNDDYRLNYKNRNVCYICQNGTSGYATAAKSYIYDLISKKIPTNIIYFNCNDEIKDNDNFHNYINSNNNQTLIPNTVIIHSTPDIWQGIIETAPYKKNHDVIIVGRTVWEFEKLIPEWVNYINNSKVDIVSVPTDWTRDCFIKNGVTKPIMVEPHVYIDYPYKKLGLNYILKKGILLSKTEQINSFENYYKFYTIGQLIKRKGILDTIETYCESFTSSDKTLLIIKTFNRNYSNEEVFKCLSQIREITSRYYHAPILFVNEQLSYDEIHTLHDISDCYIQLTKSEGFGLGIFDAFNKGKKVIVTGYGAHKYYLGENYDNYINYKLENLKKDDEIFFQFKLDDTYQWAIPDKNHAKELFKKTYNENFKESITSYKTTELETNDLIKLSFGWYDLETQNDINFRWASSFIELSISNEDEYENLFIKSINQFNKKTISVDIFLKNKEQFETIFTKTFNVGDVIDIKIPIIDVESIQIKSDYFSPFDAKISEDKRKLAFKLSEFLLEKNKNFYVQKVNKTGHLDETIYKDFTNQKYIIDKTNFFFTKDINFNIKKNKTSGILLYLQNFDDKTKKCVANLLDYKHSKNDIPIIIYSDEDLESNLPSYLKFVKIPKIPKMHGGNLNPSDKYAFWSFIESIKIAKDFNFDYYFCYEWDCKIGKDYWYDTIWEEHLSWPYEPIMTGTPVFKCPLNGCGNLLQGSADYRHLYSKECNMFMVLEYTYPYSLYTNGALTFYNTKESEMYFRKEIYDNISNKSDYMDTISPWDLEYGIRLFKKHKEKSFNKVGWLPSSYSGCGDYYYNQFQREDLLNKELKVVIHQYKYI